MRKGTKEVGKAIRGDQKGYVVPELRVRVCVDVCAFCIAFHLTLRSCPMAAGRAVLHALTRRLVLTNFFYLRSPTPLPRPYLRRFFSLYATSVSQRVYHCRRRNW